MKKRVVFILLCLCLGVTFSVTAQENVTYSDELKQKAQQENAKAQCGLGLCYENGDGVKQDYAKARYWWKKVLNTPDASEYIKSDVREELDELDKNGY